MRCSPPWGVAGEQQDAEGGGENERHTDNRLLDLGPAFVGEVQDQRGKECGTDGGNLHHPAVRLPTERVGGDDAEAGYLCDRKVNEDDAAAQHLGAERHVRAEDERGSQERRNDDAYFEGIHGRCSLRILIVCS